MKKIAYAVQMAMVGSVALSTGVAQAQQDTAQQDAAVEKIQVTGSRISRQGAIAPSPVTVLSGESLLNTGAMNIGEVLNELPALANTYSLANSGQYIGTAGLNILDLRGMGTDRTLVLVDGKRHVSSSAGSAAVDTNTIPTTWIERVEIITGGASAVYGADAVTGVVNFVLKKNIEGLDVSATRGYANDNDYKNEKYQASYGLNFDDDRGNIAFAAEYSSQNRLNALDNPWTATSYRNMSYESILGAQRSDDQLNSLAFPDDIYTPDAGYYAINNRGVFGAGFDKTFNTDGSLEDVYLGDSVDALSCAGPCDFFNLRQFTDLQPAFDRTNFNVKGNYDLNDETQIYAQAKYARTRAESLGQPAFFFFDPQNSISRDNAFLDDSVAQYMDEQGLDSIMVNRMMTDLGRRTENDERETTRVVLGVEGVFNDYWEYEAFINYGKTELERANSNNMIMANYFNALNAVEVDGQIVCADEDARAAGCVPVNIMGFGAPGDAAVDYINTTSVGTSKIEQYNVGGSVSNSGIYELPAGYVGFAAGVEYRKEESQINEPENAEGTFFNALGEDRGYYEVSEVFTELTVPVLADLPGINMMTIDGAIRIADYTSIGNATSWKLGLDWEIFDDLRMRATRSSALRAPNIGELFGEASQTFFTVDDPCREENLANLEDSELRRSNCAALGIPAGFDSNYDAQTLEGETGGNRNLDAEQSTSKTVGLVYTPGWFEGFTATVDYWKIELTDAISTVGAQTILNRCVDSQNGINNEYCNLVNRNDLGEVTLIRSYALNLAGQEAEGVDFEFGYDFDALGGAFRTNIIATYLDERKEFPFQDNPEDFYQYAGTDGEATWQGTFSLNYDRGDWEASWKTRFIDEVNLYDNQALALNPNPSSRMTYASYAITDVTVGYNFKNGISASVGVDNLFNRALPLGTTGTGGGDAAYDNIGRFGYVTISYKM